MSNTTDRRTGPRSTPRVPLKPMPAGVKWHPSMRHIYAAGTVTYLGPQR